MALNKYKLGKLIQISEDKNTDKDCYCLFIAPSLHRDTINTYYQSIKYEYEGAQQKIIPITINQLITILRVVANVKNVLAVIAGQQIHVQFAGAHGIHSQSFLAHNLQDGLVGIGLGRIVDDKALGLAHAGEFPAALAQDGFIVDIERGAEFFG